ncbi:response regulator transcription factor [Desulfobacula sp.]|uniref:response regulator n=1 Tax=Desulfobacula sp. TaxID=2593537 RepID=UPI00261F5AAC|nr:response regulator transcription factor [Desulfobacula sp.]
MKTISIVIADDHPVIRNAIKNILKGKDKFRIFGEANNGIELLALVKKIVPDIAIIDLEMPKMNGYETISKLHTIYPGIKIIAFSGFLNADNQQKAIKTGADSTISKADSSKTLIAALEAVMQGEKYHSNVSSSFYVKPLEDKNDALLTLREKQILSSIAEGKTSKQISEAYNISHWTVDKHRANIREKLKINNLSEMVRYAIDKGYIDLG